MDGLSLFVESEEVLMFDGGLDGVLKRKHDGIYIAKCLEHLCGGEVPSHAHLMRE